MEHPGGFASSPWAAMLGHGMHGMMQHEYTHPHAHASMPMDLHVPQTFPYYRMFNSACLYSRMASTTVPPANAARPTTHPATLSTHIPIKSKQLTG
ncbi:unnamed protein product [Euphydryas editha]|uniref:Uncharacterized protein n=1 Tax=Euphydryas editha TaxID=104508 RepID=A0AAU9UEG1_EUPED|nr:unnamed protein product [Euphydryas editha]